jgi:Protein of unknown function DUF262/Protein of unknown function (DUF1524)
LDVDDHPIETIFSEARRFMIPLYQRKYQWGDARLLPFWEDVEAKANEVLEGESRFQHYMGALIIAPIGESSQIGVTPRVQIVDGQQRLTTFQIFLAAVREVAKNHHCDDIIKYVEDYLFNPLKSKDTDPLTKYKLTPTPSDREVFHDILDLDYAMVRAKYSSYYWGKGLPKNTPMKALRAFQVFVQKIEQFALFGITNDDEIEAKPGDTDPENSTFEDRLEALLKAVLNRMKLVVITLGDGDDAQVIFETLNSKGEPLLAMDLVRNNIFYRAEKEGSSAEALYKKLWDPFDDTWWREAAPNIRPMRPRIDHFLAHVLTTETGSKISMKELYAEYRSFTIPKGKPRFVQVEDELMLLEKYAPIYETLEGRLKVENTISWLGQKLNAWQVTTVYPIAMRIADNGISDYERNRIAKLLYSYIVRRDVCGLTAKGLGNVFQALSHHFIKNGVSSRLFADFFLERTSDSTRFPEDEEFKNSILSQPIYKNMSTARVRDVLWELELASRTNLSEISLMPPDLQIEHVLPVSWTGNWPFADGYSVERNSSDTRAIQRNQLLHTLGNLTLISGGLNSSTSNKGFFEKKSKYSEHTGLFLNKWFAKIDEWNEQTINERGKDFMEKAIKIWPSIT